MFSLQSHFTLFVTLQNFSCFIKKTNTNMLQQNAGGNIDWMSLAAKMFMSKLNDASFDRKPRFGKTMPPTTSGLRTRSPGMKPRSVPPVSPPLNQLHPDCVATIKQFEALRVQLLRHLVLYQSQLLALKMPPISDFLSQPKKKTTHKKGKTVQNTSSKVRKQTTPKKIKPAQGNDVKKWEKIQFSSHSIKNTNTRRCQGLKKSRKSSKKVSKRKLEKNVNSILSTNTSENQKNKKRPCLSYQSYLNNYSSSTDSVYSSNGNDDFCLDSVLGKDKVHKNISFINSSLINGLKNNYSVSKLSKRKPSTIDKNIPSVYIFNSTTDEGQSSL